MSVVVVSEIEHVAYVKLHRPDVRNAFNPEMIEQLTKVFTDLSSRKDLRAVALMGEGKVFCAGADLNWMKSMVNFTLEQNRTDSLVLFKMFEAIANCQLPLVGLVQGAAFGGALGLVACCDYVIADDTAQFCFSEVKLGIAPAVISAFVDRKGILGALRPYMLSAKVFSALEAQRSGLVTDVVPTAECHQALAKVMHLFKEAGPEAVRETKKLLNVLPNLNWEEQRDRTTKLISERRVGTEGQEGLKSFLEKRQPSWRI